MSRTKIDNVIDKLKEEIGDEKLHAFLGDWVKVLGESIGDYKAHPENWYYDENGQLMRKNLTSEEQRMMSKNFIKPLPEEEVGAIDESLLLKQFRFRKNTVWHKHFDLWYSLVTGEIDLDDVYNKFEDLTVVSKEGKQDV